MTALDVLELYEVSSGTCPRTSQGQESPSVERGQSIPVLGAVQGAAGGGAGGVPPGGTWC
jgi:hypothetical protein